MLEETGLWYTSLLKVKWSVINKTTLILNDLFIEEVAELMDSVGLIKEQLLTDQRLQVNRGKQLKMYRVWIQAKYIKPVIS